MKQHLLSILFLFVLGLTSVKVSSQTAEGYKSQIEAINKEMVKYMLEGNIEKSLEMYTDDAISMPSYEPMHQGIGEIREAQEKAASSGMKFNSFVPTIVKVIPSGNLVTEIGTYIVSMSMPGMDMAMNDEGKYVTIWEKQSDGSLKIKLETWNSNVDPMTMMKSMEAMSGNEMKQ